MPNPLSEPAQSPDRTPLCADVGTRITIEISDQTGAVDRLEFELVPDTQADFAAGLMSERAPLAQALAGHAAGDAIQYRPPSGAQQTVTLLDIRPGQHDSEQAGADRNAVLGQVMDRIARRESRQIALTAELHYGSIDADGIDEE